MSVNMMAATPASSKRCARSVGVRSLTSAQPATAILPSGVGPDHDAAGIGARRLFHELRIGEGGGAQDDAGDAGFQPAIDRLHVADAAAKLDRQVDRGADRLDGVG